MKEVFSAHHVLADLLMALQVAMQNANVWDSAIPSEAALQSQEPFCIDTMSFEQWLRFVMIERFKVMLALGQDLPIRCHISPMAAEAFKGLSGDEMRSIVRCLDQIDQHLSENQ